MYIGGRGDGGRNRGDIKIPEQYSGNALARADTADETPREYKTDSEALQRAEEAFRRGYVFEEPNASADDAPAMIYDTPDGVHIPFKADFSERESDVSVAASVSPDKRSILSGGGLLSGILSGITLEHVILISLILILFDSKADDELLIMLAILFIC